MTSAPESHPPRTRTIVVAPDSFKGSARASAVALAVAEGWRQVHPADVMVLRPMADGGEGTLDAFLASAEGARRMPIRADGPDGVERDTYWVLLPDGAGVVELGETCGIELLGARRLPLDASTRGFGQAIASALRHGVDRLILGIGSSASTDGGVGMLTAFGGRFVDARGADVAAGVLGLESLHSVDLGALAAPPPGGVIVLSDVRNPLLGDMGAAAVFGPQKGLDAEGVRRADAGLARLASLLDIDPSTPGAGAAGGCGYALLAWGAELRSGAHEVAALIGLDTAIDGSDLVITGEGSFDGQSADGKAPSVVHAQAESAGVPSALIAGRISPEADVSEFALTESLVRVSGSAEAALGEPGRWLREAAQALAERFSPPR